tara:strand:- start:965 stop:1369 length:405 start_codon:yes stop_codon:yes gene_type:complete
MVMLFRQLDGTMGAQSPWRVDNQPGAINAPKPGSVAARALKSNMGGPAAAIAKQSFELPQPQVQVQEVQQEQPQQAATAATKAETPGTGANRGAVGSIGTSSGAGIAGNAEAGLVGSVNTEVQNDDVLLPYQKV